MLDRCGQVSRKRSTKLGQAQGRSEAPQELHEAIPIMILFILLCSFAELACSA